MVPSGPDEVVTIVRDFTEQRRAEAGQRRLAAEQAALRRVATLVAGDAPPDEVFQSVTEEVCRLLGLRTAVLRRFEDADDGDDRRQVRRPTGPVRASGRRSARGRHATREVLRTEAPSRRLRRRSRTRRCTSSATSATGARSACRSRSPARPGGARRRAAGGRDHPARDGAPAAAFAELVGLAVASADARNEVSASRRRIVEASDTERKRLERNLHDGAQQRLVAFALGLRVAQSQASQVAGRGGTAARPARRGALGGDRRAARARAGNPSGRPHRARPRARGRGARGPGAAVGRARHRPARPPPRAGRDGRVLRRLGGARERRQACEGAHGAGDARVVGRPARGRGRRRRRRAARTSSSAQACAASATAWKRSAASCGSRARPGMGRSCAVNCRSARGIWQRSRASDDDDLLLQRPRGLDRAGAPARRGATANVLAADPRHPARGDRRGQAGRRSTAVATRSSASSRTRLGCGCGARRSNVRSLRAEWPQDERGARPRRPAFRRGGDRQATASSGSTCIARRGSATPATAGRSLRRTPSRLGSTRRRRHWASSSSAACASRSGSSSCSPTTFRPSSRPCATSVRSPSGLAVVIAEDSTLLREGIARLLEDADFEVVGQAGTADELMLKVRSYRPDVAIVDVRMPPTQTDEGIKAAREIRAQHPDTERARALAARGAHVRRRAARRRRGRAWATC